MKKRRNDPDPGVRPRHGTGAEATLAALVLSCLLVAGRNAGAEEIRGEPIKPAAPPAGTASAKAPPATAPAEKPGGTGKGTVDCSGFDKLAGFRFNLPDEMMLGAADPLTTSLEIRRQIPESVKALNEKRVSIKGFMLPLTVHDGKASQFLLLRNQSMCCYGTTPAMNEYVIVRLAGRGITPVMDQLVTVLGTLHVGEMRENHFLSAIYRLDAEKVEGPPHL